MHFVLTNITVCIISVSETIDTVAPTVGFSSVDFRFEKTDVTLFDLGGGKKIRDIWKNYLSEVYGVIYVVDSSQPERLDEGADVINGLIEHPKVNGKPILVYVHVVSLNEIHELNTEYQ